MKLSPMDAIFAVAIALTLAAASWWGLSQALGAHPWWAARSGLIGAPIGLVLFLTARIFATNPLWIALAALLALIAAAFTAAFAKTAFVSAEDFNATAGRNWYFSWITLWTSVTLLLSALFAMRTKCWPSFSSD